MANTAKNAFANRAIPLDENILLFKRNNKKTTRNLIKATIGGSARVLSYKDIVGVQKKRDERKQGLKQRRVDSDQSDTKRSRSQELEEVEMRLERWEWSHTYSILRF